MVIAIGLVLLVVGSVLMAFGGRMETRPGILWEGLSFAVFLIGMVTGSCGLFGIVAGTFIAVRPLLTG